MSRRSRFLLAVLAAYFGVICLLAAFFSMRLGAGTSLTSFVEVLVVMVFAGLCFSLAYVLMRPVLGKRR